VHLNPMPTAEPRNADEAVAAHTAWAIDRILAGGVPVGRPEDHDMASDETVKLDGADLIRAERQQLLLAVERARDLRHRLAGEARFDDAAAVAYLLQRVAREEV